MTNPELIIWTNKSGHVSYSTSSFIAILHEQDLWQADAYWKVDKALFEISEKYRKDTMPRELIMAIFDFYEYTFGRLCWHQMPSDGSTISNLTDEKCFEHSERLSYVIRGALGGYSIKNNGLDLVNPLL